MNPTAKYGPWAVITGASDGIGRAIATRVANEGINVVLTARSEDALRERAEELARTSGVQTRVVAVDLGAPDGPAALIAAVHDLDVGLAVLAAGFGEAGPFADSTPAAAAEMVAVNVSRPPGVESDSPRVHLQQRRRRPRSEVDRHRGDSSESLGGSGASCHASLPGSTKTNRFTALRRATRRGRSFAGPPRARGQGSRRHQRRRP